MKVTLTIPELRQAAYVGVERMLRALAEDRQHRHGYDGADAWTTDIEAAAAEMVVAKVLGKYWADTEDPDYEGDICPGLQVRHSHLERAKLVVRDSDNPLHLFVLVVGQGTSYELVGWLSGWDAMDAKYRGAPNGRPPAYWVPQMDLHRCEVPNDLGQALGQLP